MNQLKSRYYALLQEAGLDPYEPSLAEETRKVLNIIKTGSLDPDLRKEAALGEESPPNLAYVLDEIQRQFDSLDLPKLKEEIFFGLFPTPTLNAESRTTPDGYLGLLYGGLYVLLGTGAEAVVFSARTEIEGGLWVLPLISRADAADRLKKVLIALQHRRPYTPPPLLPRSTSELSWLANVIDGGLHFLMAHEYAHAFLGHLDSPLQRINKTTPKVITVNQKSIDDEWAADRKAIEIILHKVHIIQHNTERKSAVFEIAALIAGCLITLMLESWIEARVPTDHLTHPPAIERLIKIRAAFEDKLGGSAAYREGWNFASHLESLGWGAGLVQRPLFTTKV